MGAFSRSDGAAAWPCASSSNGLPPGALGGFRSGVGMVDSQLDVEDIVRDRVRSVLQRTYEIGCSFSCSRACCRTGLVYGNIRGPKAQY
jgi:hypothetical protein